jgi:hypothetical protein
VGWEFGVWSQLAQGTIKWQAPQNKKIKSW